MDTTIIQVPIDKSLRDKAAAIADTSGFSSLQEVIRVFLKQFAAKEIGVTFIPRAVRLSDRNDRRYSEMIEEVRSGKINTFAADSAEKLLKHLHDKNS